MKVIGEMKSSRTICLEHGFIEHVRQRSLLTHGTRVCCARGRGMEGQGSPASRDRRPSPSATSSLSCGMILNLFLPSEPLLPYLRNERAESASVAFRWITVVPLGAFSKTVGKYSSGRNTGELSFTSITFTVTLQ